MNMQTIPPDDDIYPEYDHDPDPLISDEPGEDSVMFYDPSEPVAWCDKCDSVEFYCKCGERP